MSSVAIYVLRIFEMATYFSLREVLFSSSTETYFCHYIEYGIEK